MTARERAEKLCYETLGRVPSKTHVDFIERAILDAENSALERAAQVADENCKFVVGRTVKNALHFAAEGIRALKVRP